MFKLGRGCFTRKILGYLLEVAPLNLFVDVDVNDEAVVEEEERDVSLSLR